MARLITALGILWVAAIGPASAQDGESAEDLTLPPKIEDPVAPGDARLEPPPEEGEDMLEAVVTGGQTDFRLPDLGTSLRKEKEKRDPNQRIEVKFLYLYDPENVDPAEEAFPSLEEQLDVGMLPIFEVRIGRNRERD